VTAVPVVLVTDGAGRRVHAAADAGRTVCGRPVRQFRVVEWGDPGAVTCRACRRADR
jgi:hypothetical protein